MAVPEHTVHYLEIVTPDVEAMRRLYCGAYGWDFQATGPELGNAFVAELPDGSLFGIRPPMHEEEKPTVRPYLRVADLELAIEEASQLGAQIALDSMDIPGYGRIAIYIFGGIEQGIWEVA